MRRRDDDRVRAMRDLLAGVRAENSRMVAAAIGGHLSRITKEAGEARALGEASDTVRDASLDLLKALHRGHDVNGARKAALESVELLEAALPDPAALTKRSPSGPEHHPAAARTKEIRKAARSGLSAVLPLWRN
ncbi:hypothetical protein [Enterovirga sp. CN4-39]|uniref:hypothetical protein n=1 Tax=Enterovirga sp. CN4-39 TaxID=3400910 RepID=UPI003C0EE7C9